MESLVQRDKVNGTDVKPPNKGFSFLRLYNKSFNEREVYSMNKLELLIWSGGVLLIGIILGKAHERSKDDRPSVDEFKEFIDTVFERVEKS